ncbi:MAG: hypothetical protein AAFU67_09600 [Bacteroidota bacterium]
MKQFYLLLCLLFATASVSAQTTHFVDADAAGANDGTSWADAFSNLSDALAGAASGDIILVAEGTYTPPADSTFFVSTNLTIIGGFDGTSTNPEDADPATNVVILSGDTAGDDVPGDTQTNRGDNVRIMFVDSLITDPTFIVGLNFVGGTTGITPEDEFIDDYTGGGILSYSPIAVSLCNFTDNFADFGSGIGLLGGDASGSLIDQINASGNVTASNGAVYVNGADLVAVQNSIFDGNTADRSAVYGFASNGFTVDNCTFTNNTGLNRGSAVGFVFTYPGTLNNCVINNNPIGAVGGAIYVASDADIPLNDPLFGMYIDSCSVVGNASDGNFGGGLLSLDGNLFITNSEFRANSTPGRGGAIWATNNSVVEGKILDARNSSFTENQGTVLGAAIYTQNPFNLTIDSSEVSQNGNETASGRGAICMLQDFGNTGIKQDVVITNTEFFNNVTTAEGAAIYIQNPTNGTTIDISDASFIGNIGPSIGGAMFFRPGNTSTFNNVIGNLNQADDGGFIWALEEQNADSLNIPVAKVTVHHCKAGFRNVEAVCILLF